MKRAQGLPLNTIILAILAIVVLVALILIFSGQINYFYTNSRACPGTCSETLSCDNGVGYPSDYCKKQLNKKEGENAYCCPARLVQKDDSGSNPNTNTNNNYVPT